MLKYLAAALAGMLWATSGWAADKEPSDIELALGVGVSMLDPDAAPPLDVTDDQGTTMYFSLAQQVNEDWQVQFRYTDMGEAEINDKATVRYDAIAITVQYELPFFETSPFAINTLAGAAMVDIGASYLSLEDRSSNEAVLGFSLDYEVVETWTARLETLAWGQDITTVTLGVAKRF